MSANSIDDGDKPVATRLLCRHGLSALPERYFANYVEPRSSEQTLVRYLSDGSNKAVESLNGVETCQQVK